MERKKISLSDTIIGKCSKKVILISVLFASSNTLKSFSTLETGAFLTYTAQEGGMELHGRPPIVTELKRGKPELKGNKLHPSFHSDH